MRFPPKFESLFTAIAILVSAIGCTREIGDSCSTGTDCSQTGGRTCDTTMPGGYCTQANCEPDSCPEEAACIGFYLRPSTADACKNLTETRELRQFCMRRCSSQDDCRSGYVCKDLSQPLDSNNVWGAARLDNSSSDGHVCTLEYGAVPAISDKGTKAEYCTATPFDNSKGYYAVGGSSGGNPGGGGAAGNGNSGSAGTDPTGAGAGTAGTSASAGSGGEGGIAGATTAESGAGTAGRSDATL